MIRLAALTGVALVLHGVAADPAGGQERRVLTGVTLVDGSAAPPRANARVVVQDGRFACVSGPDGCAPAPGDVEVSLDGSWLLPGLVDAHVHLPLESDPVGASLAQRLRFAMGVTTVRDAGSGVVEALLAAAAASENPEMAEPRIVPTAQALPEYAERWNVAPGPPLVRHLVAIGVRGIKIKDPFDDGLRFEEIAEARRLGVPSYGHYWDGPPPVVYAYEAIDAGISGLSHLMGIAPLAQPPGSDVGVPEGVRVFWPEFWEWRNGLWLTTDPAELSRLVLRMVDADVWLEPLLVSEYYWLTPMPGGELSFVQDVPRPLRERFRRTAREGPQDGPAYPGPYERMEAFVVEFAAGGGRIVAGSDGAGLPGVPGLDLHEEIRLLGEAGLGELGGVRAATSDAAIALARSDIGLVEAGRLADALVYDHDPFADADGLLRPRLVIKGGVEHDAAVLRARVADDYRSHATALRRRDAFLLGLVLLASVALLAAVARSVRRLVGARSARRAAAGRQPS